jgi:hypothetical protein
MKKSILVVPLVIVIVIAAAIFMQRPRGPADNGEVTDEPDGVDLPPEDTTEETGPLKGVSLSPRSHEEFGEFFVKAAEAGEVVTWAGDWGFLDDGVSAPHVVAALSDQQGLDTIVVVTYFTQGTGELVRPLNESNRQAYIDGAVEFVESYEPSYIGFGIEVNSFWMNSDEGYGDFVGLFEEVYPLVKEASPNTKVFTVFQLERMKGLHGGLFGGVNDDGLSQWGLLDDFPDADIFAFTTYPCLIHNEPSEMPDDYYTEILDHTSKEVLIIESGWFRDGPEGWESDEGEQAEFVRALFDLTEELDPSVIVWSFLYDQDVEYPFDSMGLLDVDEACLQPWEAWVEE